MRILVVDDQQDLLDGMGKLLTLLNHEPVLERDPRQALGLIDSGEFDVLITDMVMPNMGGREVIKQVRGKHPDLWIVAISGGGDSIPANTNLRISQAYGADRVLYKPFCRPELMDALKKS